MSNSKEEGVDPQDHYVLSRDCNASSRLTAQHYLWKELLGFLIHPNIPTQTPGLKIADVATGNGIWLHDIARDKPTSDEFHGFDISLDQVGHKLWLPVNIHMHIWNIFDKPPAQFVGYFDIVHVRLITIVVQNNDPRPILENLTLLLKPGGYLQWDEVDTMNWWTETVPGVSAENLNKLHNQITTHGDWKSRLDQVMMDNGYTSALLYTYRYGLGMARIWNDLSVCTWKDFAHNMLKPPGASGELERKGMNEVRKGATLMVPSLVWVARKA